MRAFVYCRVGSFEQLSFEEQIKYVCDYVKKNNHIIVGKSSDIGVYNTLIRPGFEPLFALIENGKVDVVIVKDITRISRDFSVTAEIVDKLKKHNAKLFCISEHKELGDKALIDSLSPEMALALKLRQVSSGKTYYFKFLGRKRHKKTECS